MGSHLRRVAVLLMAVTMVFGAVACSKSDTKANTKSSGSSGAASSANSAVIKDFKFQPDTLKVKVGTEITWTNQDSADHTVSTDGDSQKFDSGHLAKGKTFKQKFAKAGTYKYMCDIHTYMTGTIQVS